MRLLRCKNIAVEHYSFPACRQAGIFDALYPHHSKRVNSAGLMIFFTSLCLLFEEL